MSALKEAILRSQQQRALLLNAPPPQPANPVAPSAPELPAVAPGRTGRQQQLASLRRRFEANVQRRAPRFEDGRTKWLLEHAGSNKGRGRSEQQQQQSQRQGDEALLTSKLEGDILSVLSEAGLPPRTLRPVVSAARKGIITSNPGVLLCQLLRYMSCLTGSCLGRRQAMGLLAVYPAVLNAAPDTLSWHLEELEEIFGDKTASMVTKRPALLFASPFTVWTHLEAMSRLLDISLERTQALVARQPRLLLNSTAALASRLEDMQDVTGLDVGAVQSLITSQPALLTYHPATLAHNLECMAVSLGTDADKVAKLVCRAPSLIMFNHETLASKLEALEQVLCCNADQVLAMVLRQPSILCLSIEMLQAKFDQLSVVLGTSQAAAAELLQSNPALLTLAPGTLRCKLDHLQQAISDAGALAGGDGVVHGATENGTSAVALMACGEEEHLVDCQPDQTASVSGADLQGAIGTVACPAASTHALICSSKRRVAEQDGGPDGGDAMSRHGMGGGSTGALQGQGTVSAAAGLVTVWQGQLSEASPSVRAAYGCFSAQRYQRLPQLCRALLDRGHATSGDRIIQRHVDSTGRVVSTGIPALVAVRQWSLSQVLRASEKQFTIMLQSLA